MTRDDWPCCVKDEKPGPGGIHWESVPPPPAPPEAPMIVIVADEAFWLWDKVMFDPPTKTI